MASITFSRFCVKSSNVSRAVEVQHKCPLLSLRWYQMLVPEELPGFPASADFPHQCTSSPCLCGFPTPSPSVEWTSPEAWPAALPSIFPAAGRSASAAMRRPATRLRPDRRLPQREHLLLDLALRPAVRELQPKVLTRFGIGGWDGGNWGSLVAAAERCRTGRCFLGGNDAIPHVVATSGRPAPPAPRPPLRRNCGVADWAVVAGCACNTSRCCPAPLSCGA